MPTFPIQVSNGVLSGGVAMSEQRMRQCLEYCADQRFAQHGGT